MTRSRRTSLVFFIVLLSGMLIPGRNLNAQCCVGTRGNIDNDAGDNVDIGDLITLVDHLFITFTPLACEDEGNVDGEPGVDIGDAIFLIDHLFITFTPMLDCPGGGGGTGPQLGDLLITEIMMDPNALADNVGEWFEVTNISGDSIDIQGLLFTGATAADTFRVTSSIILAPVDFFTFARSNNPGFVPRYVYSGMDLNNGPDEISMSYDGLLLDKVTWSATSTGVSRSLRFVGYNYLFNDADSNWCPSIVPMLNGDFGSPNTIGASACDLNIQPLIVGAVIFSEFLANPFDLPDPDGEWFELYNPSDTSIYDLQGSVIQLGTFDSIVVSSSLLIYPGEYLVFGYNSAAAPFVNYVYGDGNFFLPNSGITSFTLTKNGLTIDGASYNTPTASKSRSLDTGKLNSIDNDNLSNWCDSNTPYGLIDLGTPGYENDPCTP